MKLYELLTKYSNDEIIDSLKKNYKGISEEAYLNTLEELRGLKPSEEKQNTKIYVEFTKNVSDEDNVEYLQCGGIGQNDEGIMTKWGLEYIGWEEWLAKEIDNKTLKEFDELTILACIMSELTYNGFTSKDVNERKEWLANRVKALNEDQEYITLSDFEDILNNSAKEY